MNHIEDARGGYVYRMQEYEKELAQRRLIVFLAKLGLKSAQKLIPFGEYNTIETYDIKGPVS